MMQVPPGESMLAGARSWPLWLFAAWVISAVAALLSIWLGHQHSRKAKALWTTLVVALPFLGALAWFLFARERRRS